MANIVFTPANPRISAAGGTLELQVAYMGVDDTWDIDEVATPSDISETNREVISSSEEGIVYLYTFDVAPNVGAARTIEVEFGAWNGEQGQAVVNTVEILQAAATNLSAQVSPSVLNFDVLPDDKVVTCSIYNTGSTLSVTPVSTPNWIIVEATGLDQYIYGVDNGVRKYYKVSVARNTGDARNASVGLQVTSAGQTVTPTFEVSQSGFTVPAQVTVETPSANISSDANSVSTAVTYSVSGISEWTIEAPSSSLSGVTFTSNSIATISSNLRRYSYTASIPVNQSASQRDITLTFKMTSGSTQAVGTMLVSQAGRAQTVAPTVKFSISSNLIEEPDNLGANEGFVFFVSGGSQANINISSSYTYSNLGYTTTGNWITCSVSVQVPANNTANTASGYFTVQAWNAGGTGSKTLTILTPGTGQTPTYPGEVQVTPPSYSNVPASDTQSLFYVTYSNAVVGDYSILSAQKNNVTSVELVGSYGYDATSRWGTYKVTYPANTSESPAYRSVRFRMSGSGGEYSKVVEINQLGAGTPPTPTVPTGSIIVEQGNYQTCSANANNAYFTVRYKDCISGGYTIDGAGGNGSSTVVSGSTTTDGNDKIVTYTASFSNNLTTEDIQMYAWFQMHRGESPNIEYVNGTAYYLREGVHSPGGVGVLIGPYNPTNVNANVTQSTFFVTYSNALTDPYVIHYPSFSLGAYLISSTSVDNGNDTIRTYTIGYPANQTANSVTHSAYFKMSYGQYYADNTAYIQQAPAATPTYSISCSWDYYDAGTVQQIARSIRVTYYGGQYPDDFVGNPLTSSNIVGISATTIPSPYSDHCEVTYGITASNNGQNATVTFNIPGAGVTKTATIHFSGAPDPSTPQIVVPGSPFSIQSGDQIVSFTAIYKNSYPGWTIGRAEVNKTDMRLASGSMTISGSDQIVNYEVTFTGNATNETIERRVFLAMYSGSEAVNGGPIIYQAGRQATGTITVRPQHAWVSAWDSQSVCQVTYSFAGINYQVMPPTGSTGVTVSPIGGGTVPGEGSYYTYRITFPTNPSTTTPITRSVTFRMVSESLAYVQNAYVYQDYQGGGGNKQILVNPTSKWLNANETTATTQVTYMGFSSAAQVGTPSCPSGWTATVGNVQESSGQVTINWIFSGPANTSSNTKTSSFSIGASGATSKTFTVFQYGTGGGGGSETTHEIPVWTNHYISSSLASDTLVVMSGSKVIFNDKVYASPEGELKVDLNRIYEPFVVSDPVPVIIGDNGKGTMVSQSHAIPEFTANLQNTGVGHLDYILKDWSYGLNFLDRYRDIISSWGNLPCVVGQYFVATMLNASPVDHAITIIQNGQGSQPSVVKRTYQDYCWKISTCDSQMITYSGAFKAGCASSNAKWVVYFRNKRNGLEWLVLEGTVVPMVEVTRNNYLQGVVRYTKTYLNKVVDKWKCNTGTMSDEWSYLVSEMIQSPNVALHDIKNDVIYAVKPVTTSVEKKTFWNQGRQFATYQFDLESILTQARR